MKDTTDQDRETILDCCRRLDVKAICRSAVRYQKHRDIRLRLQAALLLFQAGKIGPVLRRRFGDAYRESG